MRAYLTYFRLRVITNLQYRSAAISGVLTQFFFGFVFILVYLAFYSSNQNVVEPMTWQHLVSYIWLQQAFFALIYPYERDGELISMIKNGNLSYELLRPQNFYLKWYIKIYSKKIISCLLRSPLVIIVGSLLPYPYRMSLPASFNSFLLFLVSLLLASILITAFIMLVHVIIINTLDDRGIANITFTLCDLFLGGVIPLAFFPSWLKNIAYFLPFRFISDYPLRVYSGSIPFNEGISLLLGGIVWTIILIVCGFILTDKSLKKAVIQGG